MRKISKAITNKKFLKKSDNLYSKDTISLDNPKNRKYLDNITYQEYLRKIQKENSDYNDQ